MGRSVAAWPLLVTFVLRPLGGMAGAYLTGRVEGRGVGAASAA